MYAEPSLIKRPKKQQFTRCWMLFFGGRFSFRPFITHKKHIFCPSFELMEQKKIPKEVCVVKKLEKKMWINNKIRSNCDFRPILDFGCLNSDKKKNNIHYNERNKKQKSCFSTTMCSIVFLNRYLLKTLMYKTHLNSPTTTAKRLKLFYTTTKKDL